MECCLYTTVGCKIDILFLSFTFLFSICPLFFLLLRLKQSAPHIHHIDSSKIAALLAHPEPDSPLNCDAGTVSPPLLLFSCSALFHSFLSSHFFSFLSKYLFPSTFHDMVSQHLSIFNLLYYFHSCSFSFCSYADVCAGNLLRSGDVRGYNSLALMYTRLFAAPL